MKRFVMCCMMLILATSLITASDSVSPSEGYSAEDVLGEYAFNNVNYSDGYYYANGSGADGVSYANIYSEANGLEDTLGYPVAYYDSCRANGLSIFCSFTVKDPVENCIWVGFTSTGNADDRLFTVDIATKTWTEQAVIPGMIDLEIFGNEIFVSGAAGYSDPNSIYHLDTTGTGTLTKIIEVGGSGCGFGVGTDGSIVCASYGSSENKLFRWPKSAIDSIPSGAYLTISDADILSTIAAGGADTDVDEAGHVFFAYNDYSSGSAVDMWNGIVGDDDHAIRIATGSGDYGNWFSGIACDGDVTNGGPMIIHDFYVYGFIKVMANTIHGTMAVENSIGEAPLTVSCTGSAVFTGSETPSNFLWDFDEDGVIDTVGENVTWTYTEAGIYDITMIVQGQSLNDTLTEYDRVEVVESLFAGPVGTEGTTAMAYDSSAFMAWAVDVAIERGPIDIREPEGTLASYGTEEVAVGAVTSSSSVVSLGDGGTATATFIAPIYNGEGPDFAVFENSFSDTFLELAFVEVSSDGTNFIRFPAISLTPADAQVGGFGSVDCRYIHNLAGKYRTKYGTPFDLADLADAENLDVNAVTHVRIVDAVGCIQDAYCTYDSQGHKVNDPWPTAFNSSGFDLDGIGVVHQSSLLAEMEIEAQYGSAPFNTEFRAHADVKGAETVLAYYWDMNGDGSIDTTGESVSWTYTVPGQYDVTLIAEGTYSNDTLSVENAVTVINSQLFENVNLAVLTEGNYGSSDAGLFNFDADSVGFIANAANPLGDTGQSMKVHKDKLYVVMNGSNALKVFDISEGSPVYSHTIDLPDAGPRYVDFDDADNAYISCWSLPGVIVYDLQGEICTDTLSVAGLPEGLICENDHLYVSQNMLPDRSAGNKIYDFDLSSGTYDTYNVASNPGNILLKDRILYVTSQYYDESWNTYTATSAIQLDDGTVTIKEHGMDFSAADLFILNDEIYRSIGRGVYRLNQDLSLDSASVLGDYSGIYSASSFENIVFIGLSDYAAPDQIVILDSLGNEIGIFPIDGACPGSVLAWNTPGVGPGIANWDIPETTELQPAYPNPFNPMTKIPFTLSEISHVQITIYDISGRKLTTLVDQDISAGYHEVIWNAGSYASGIYLVRMKTANKINVKKITLQK